MVFSTNKTDRQDMTEILLKVVLNIIILLYIHIVRLLFGIYKIILTSHLDVNPVSCNLDHILCRRPSFSGWLELLLHVHWCFCMIESYANPININDMISCSARKYWQVKNYQLLQKKSIHFCTLGPLVWKQV
jgi:hypothetical protein